MQGKRSSRTVAAVVALASVLAAPTLARHPARQHAAGDFDFYLLTLSINPSFCAMSASNRQKPDCRSLTQARFEQTPMTIHGLWPNRARVSVNQQPQFCSHVPLDLSPAVKADLERYMPGGPALWQHEWSRHGTCSGLAPDAYFSKAVDLARQMEEAIGAAVVNDEKSGKPIKVTDLIGAVSGRNAAASTAMVVYCQQPTGSGGSLIEEVRLTLSKDFAFMPASSVGLGQNSGCAGGAGRIPTVRQ
jgi:ribonuclease T2